jgi:hypothetical protein
VKQSVIRFPVCCRWQIMLELFLTYKSTELNLWYLIRILLKILNKVCVIKECLLFASPEFLPLYGIFTSSLSSLHVIMLEFSHICVFSTTLKPRKMIGRRQYVHVNNYPTRWDYMQFYFCKLLALTPSIIGSTYTCNHSIWHWLNRLCYLPLSWSSCSTTVPDAVITIICAPDDGWQYHPKHVERAVYRNITVYSCISLGNYSHWFTMHWPMNIKYVHVLYRTLRLILLSLRMLVNSYE